MKNLLLFILLFFTASVVFAQYQTPGNNLSLSLNDLVDMSGGTVTESGGNYFINNDLTISATDTLTISSGATIKTEAAKEITVEGVLIADAPEEILFTAVNQPAPFMGFRFEESSESVMRNCIVEYGGGIEVVNSDMLFDNCIIRYNTMDNGSGAIDIFQSLPVIQYCEIYENEGSAISSGSNSASSPQIYFNTIYENTTGNTNRPQINLGTSAASDSTRIVGNTITGLYEMAGGVALTTLMGGSVRCRVEDNQITNNRYGIAFLGNDIKGLVRNNVITGNNIQNEPMQGGSGINIFGDATTTVIISGNFITGNLWGITLQNAAAPDLGNTTNPDSQGNNIIFGNGNSGEIYDLYNNTAQNIKAENNYWGTNDEAEVEDHIFHQNDDPSLGIVDFQPIKLNDYQPLLTENSVWSVTLEKYVFEGDTVINDVTYQKLYKHFDLDVVTPEELEYYAALRDDTLARKVYVIEKDTETEELLYDFSLEVGDVTSVYTLYNANYTETQSGYNEVQLIAIETVTLNGQDYRQFELETADGFEVVYWIEGIGSTWGPTIPATAGPWPFDVAWPVLLCFEQDETLIYDNPMYSTCFESTTSVEEHSESSPVRIYPTIADDVLYVDVTENKDFTIEIYDVSGRMVKTSRNMQRIEVSDLQSGIYLVRFTNGTIPVKQKIIKL